jgi:glycoside/pentoside/hexuronide:cation symporter, GPH family
LRISMSGFIVPYLGLGAELSPDYDDRSSVVAFRVIFGMLGMLAPLMLGFGLFLSGHDGLLNRAAYAPFGWTSGALLGAAGMLATGVSLKVAPRLTAVRCVREHLVRRLAGEVQEVFRNPSFRRLFGGVLLFFAGQGLTNALGLDANQYFWSLDVKQIQTVAMSLVGGLALGLPVGFALIGRAEKITIVLAGIAIFALAQGLPALMQVLGLLPDGIRLRVVLLIGAGVLAGVAATLVTISFQSALADAVDEHELMFAARREGLYFASLSFAFKSATGLGSMIAGFLLDLIRFPSTTIASGHAVNIAPDILRNLGLLYGPAAGCITAASLFFFSRYRLNRAAHDAITEALAQRR